MRFRSPKRARLYVERRRIVAEMLAEFPVCQRCSAARSDDIHEVVSRARGGSLVLKSNLRALCRPCHTEVTDNPAQAALEGWSRHSWEA